MTGLGRLGPAPGSGKISSWPFAPPILLSLALLALLVAPTGVGAQDVPRGDKVPIERCDCLACHRG